MMGEFCDTRANIFLFFPVTDIKTQKKSVSKNIRPHRPQNVVSVSASYMPIYNEGCRFEIKLIDILGINVLTRCCSIVSKSIT